jgi:hypothetical protein
LYVFIKCFNGTFSLKDDNRQDLGNGPIVFIIEKGKGINHYVDYKTAIWIAQNFELSLYKGKNWRSENTISPHQALQMESILDSIQVTVEVHPGYRFDLGNMTLDK